MQIPATINRISCNQASRVDFFNDFGGLPPVIIKAGTVQFACAVFTDDPSVATNFVDDLTNVVTANLVIRDGSVAGTVLCQKVLPAESLIGALTYDQWTANTGAQFTFTLSTTDTNFTPVGSTLFIGIGVTLANGQDVSLTKCATAQFIDYGIFSAPAAVTPDTTAWDKATSDARYALQTGLDSLHVRPSITGLTGGGAANLDGLASAALATGFPLLIFTPLATLARLTPDADPASGAQVIAPLDHDATTNPRSWRITPRGGFRPDIIAATGGSTSLAAIPHPADGQIVEYRDGDGILYRYQFTAGDPTATSTGGGALRFVRAADNTGVWRLLFLQDLLGQNDAPGSTQFFGDLTADSLSAAGWVSGAGLLLSPQAATPATPVAGALLYLDAAGDLHALHATGTNHVLSAH